MEKFNPRKIRHIKQINKVMSIFFHTKKEKQGIIWSDVKKILVIDFTGIGDLVMLVPFLRILKKNTVSAQIDLCCNAYGKILLDKQNLVNNFYIFNGSKYFQTPLNMIKNVNRIRKYINLINKNQYDVAIEPRGDIRYIFFMHYINSRRKISYNYTGGDSLLTDVVFPSDSVEHLLEDKLYLLESIGCTYTEDDKYPQLILSASDLKKIDFFIKQKGIAGSMCLGIHPGASTYIKEWDKYSELITVLAPKYPDIIFIIFEGPNENNYVNRIMNDNINLGNRLIHIREPLENYLWIVSICSIMICNDSAAAHIASAYQIPTVIIYGPTEPRFACPVSKSDNVFISKSNCIYKPCRNTECRLGSQECITSISVEDVVEGVKKILN